MKRVFAGLLCALLGTVPLLSQAAERAIEKEVVVRATLDEAWAAWTTRLNFCGWGDGGEWDKTYAYFDRAWGGVLANLKKRFEQGPQDWTEWLKQLEAYRAQAARQAAQPASSATPTAPATKP